IFAGQRRGIAALTFWNTGFLLAFALHFAVLAPISNAWTYLLYDFKILFGRRTYTLTGSPGSYLRSFLQTLSVFPSPFLGVFAVFGWTWISRRRKWVSIPE